MAFTLLYERALSCGKLAHRVAWHAPPQQGKMLTRWAPGKRRTGVRDGCLVLVLGMRTSGCSRGRAGTGALASVPCSRDLSRAARQKAGTTMDVLYAIPAWLIALVLLLLLVAIVEGGYRLGCRIPREASERSRSVFATLLGAVLALLGLLLAFSFAMAVTRYDLLQALGLREASAIGTAYWRTSFLEEAARVRLQGLLRAYVEVRFQYYEAGRDQRQVARATTDMERLHRELWAVVSTEARRNTTAVHVLWVAQALNEVIDRSTAYASARDNHVPETVLWLLGMAAVLTGGLSGYACGATAHRQVLATSVLAVLVTLVVYAILDLDRPQRGLIRVQQQAMRSLRERVQYDSAW